MTDTRLKGRHWRVANDGGACLSVEHAQLAVLMDIRDELKDLNALLRCHRFRSFPDVVQRIDRRLQKHLPLRTRAKRRAKRKGGK